MNGLMPSPIISSLDKLKGKGQKKLQDLKWMSKKGDIQNVQCWGFRKVVVNLCVIKHQINWWTMQACGRNVIRNFNSHKCALQPGWSDFHQCNLFLCAIYIGSGAANPTTGGLLSSPPDGYFHVVLNTWLRLIRVGAKLWGMVVLQEQAWLH